jgi:hypothetical protein
MTIGRKTTSRKGHQQQKDHQQKYLQQQKYPPAARAALGVAAWGKLTSSAALGEAALGKP